MHAGSVMSDSCYPKDQPAGCPCPWGSPGKDTAVGCHVLLQGAFPTQGLNPHLPHLLHRKADSFITVPPGKPIYCQVSNNWHSQCWNSVQSILTSSENACDLASSLMDGLGKMLPCPTHTLWEVFSRLQLQLCPRAFFWPQERGLNCVQAWGVDRAEIPVSSFPTSSHQPVTGS